MKKKDAKKGKKLNWFDKMMLEITFAEAGVEKPELPVSQTNEHETVMFSEKNKSLTGPDDGPSGPAQNKPAPAKMFDIGNIFQMIEEAMMATAFAEAGEHDYARSILGSGKNSYKKVLLSTDCPEVPAKVLSYAFSLCKRLESALEVFQIIPADTLASYPRESFERGMSKLQPLQEKLNRLGISYHYSIKASSLHDELIDLAQKRRDIMTVIIPFAEKNYEREEDFQTKIIKLFSCPVIFYES